MHRWEFVLLVIAVLFRKVRMYGHSMMIMVTTVPTEKKLFSREYTVNSMIMECTRLLQVPMENCILILEMQAISLRDKNNKRVSTSIGDSIGSNKI